MILLDKYCFNTPLIYGGILIVIENVLLIIAYFAMASYYILLGINLLMS